eukprot:TRINITY_DN199_c0_g2_i1.p1 TRINITY_DN199_c0_g2~~TRINITY_DN199_c0_g2_i1.p1  ORF type:complete len:186 (+),score=26.22 TRINITY_DN199_c0_g2_i1:46-558(+)
MASKPNIDWTQMTPGVLTPQAEYLEAMDAKQRGLGEKITYRTGIVYLLGLTAGGSRGLFKGIQESAGMTTRLRLNMLLNSMGRGGAAAGNAGAVCTLAFTAIEHGLAAARDGEEDAINTIAAGTMAGMAYKSSAGLRSIAVGGGAGAIASAIFAFGYPFYARWRRNSREH